MANTQWLERLTAEKALELLSKEDLIKKLKEEYGWECPVNRMPPNLRKELLIGVILDCQFGECKVKSQPTGSSNWWEREDLF